MIDKARRVFLPVLVAAVVGPWVARAQDPLQGLNNQVREKTGGMFGFTFEERTRWEEKSGVSFGKAVNQQDMLSRLRIGARFDPTDWLTISAMGQDARAPFYGAKAPNSMRDPMDLEEAYVEFLGRQKTGFGATFGRQFVSYGETRVIGPTQWGNAARTFDTARMYYRTSKARFEILMVSPVKVVLDQFNNPELGERIWGTYNVFSNIGRGVSVDAYALRHSQNKIGGWTGTGTLGTDTFGGRLYGPLPDKFAYSLEGMGQTGHLGLLTQRAYAWFAGASRGLNALKRPLNLSAEFKGASGTRLGAIHNGTYDQLMSANHDKFGQQDLFGWRNLKTFKTLETLSLSKALAVNLMYSNHWLFSPSDSLYNSSGSSIAVSKKGTAGTHVGQELDSYLTCKRGAHLIGAGYGHFFAGDFVVHTTPHVNPRYLYLFQQYSFK